jgi:hypothetical protein
LVTVCSAVIATSCSGFDDIIEDSFLDALCYVLFGVTREDPIYIGDYPAVYTYSTMSINCDKLGISEEYVSETRVAYATGEDKDDLYYKIYDDSDGRHFLLKRVDGTDFPQVTISFKFPDNYELLQPGSIIYWGKSDFLNNHTFYRDSKFDKVFDKLEEEGFIAVKTHYSPLGIKTNASNKELMEIVREIVDE